MKELKILRFDDLIAENDHEVFVQAETPQGYVGLRFPVSAMGTMHQVLAGLQRLTTPPPGVVVSKFLDPIFDIDQGVALLRFVSESGNHSCLSIEATALPSLQDAIRHLPWSRCDMPAPYGSDA
ncbi:hypothetical protein K9F62_03190 [Desulfovibrio sp. JY]|nr:hypothetical protein K9F62_03190 [Desulfovibrio sp. JY]